MVLSMSKKVKGQTNPKGKSGSLFYINGSQSESPSGVHESSPKSASGRKIETLLSDIVTRLDRIEEKIDENVYPPESAIRPEMIRKIRKAHADIKKGKGKTYNSVDDFFQEIEA